MVHYLVLPNTLQHLPFDYHCTHFSNCRQSCFSFYNSCVHNQYLIFNVFIIIFYSFYGVLNIFYTTFCTKLTTFCTLFTIKKGQEDINISFDILLMNVSLDTDSFKFTVSSVKEIKLCHISFRKTNGTIGSQLDYDQYLQGIYLISLFFFIRYNFLLKHFS